MQKLRQRVFSIVSKTEAGDRLGHIFDITFVLFILLSVLSIILGSVESLASRYQSVFVIFEIVTVIVFTLEYFARIWTAPLLYPSANHPYLKYIVSPMAIIDLAAVLPFYLPFIIIDLRFLRLLRLFRMARLLRVLKFGRYLKSMQNIAYILRKSRTQLITSLLSCFILMLIASILMYGIENAAQPEAFPNVFAALWWAVCTLTTVGYGDIYPITVVGKLLASVISLLGIGVVAIPTGIISAGFIAAMNENYTECKRRKTHCPYCGQKLED